MSFLPLAYACPTCGAEIDQLCRNEAGAVIRGFHSERWQMRAVERMQQDDESSARSD